MKGIAIIAVTLVALVSFLVFGADTISSKMEKYVEDNYKSDDINYEKYTFLNAYYCNLVAKYDRSLALLDKYDQRFYKDENREKSVYLRAKDFDQKLDGRPAKELYQKYMEDFPQGSHFEKAKERYLDLKTYL